MKISPEEIQRRMNHFKDVLKHSGVKLTHQRIEIFREVAGSGDHPDAETIFKAVRKKLPTVSFDTIYRTLWMLIDLNLIKTLGQARERVKFDANIHHHHHFICTRCGKVCDFYSQELDKLKVPDNIKKLGKVERIRVEVKGLCVDCAKKKGK